MYDVGPTEMTDQLPVSESGILVNSESVSADESSVMLRQREAFYRYALLTLEEEGVTIDDVFEAGVALEAPMVGHLAKNHTEAMLDELARLAQCETHAGRENFDCFLGFHTALMRLAGNETLRLFSEMINLIIAEEIRSIQPCPSGCIDDAARVSIRTHRLIIETVRSGDSVAAEDISMRVAPLTSTKVSRSFFGGAI